MLQYVTAETLTGFQCYEMRTCQIWDDPENAYLSCAKRPDLLTTRPFFNSTCVKNVLMRTKGYKAWK